MTVVSYRQCLKGSMPAPDTLTYPGTATPPATNLPHHRTGFKKVPRATVGSKDPNFR